MTIDEEMAVSEQRQVLWQQNRYDSGLYGCKVVRDGEKGTLTVTLLGNIDHVLHEEPVKVERQDIDKWKSTCAAVISNPSLRSMGSRAAT